MLICAHFCPPQPCWSAQHNCISVGCLLNLDVCTLFTRRTRHRMKAVNGYLMAGSARSSHYVGNLRLEGNSKLSVSPTSTFSPAPQSLAGKYTTSWTSSQGLSEFFPKMIRCPSVEGGRATKVSQEDGCMLNHQLSVRRTIDWLGWLTQTVILMIRFKDHVQRSISSHCT